jgi:ComEC/Rec2-related protein
MFINRIIALSFGVVGGVVAATLFDVDFIWLKWVSLVVIFLSSSYVIWTLHCEHKWREFSRVSIFLPLIIAGFAVGIFRANSVINSRSPAVLFFQKLHKNELIDIRGEIVAEPEVRSSHTLNLRVRISQIKRASESSWQSVMSEDVRVTVSKPCRKADWGIFAKLADSRSYGNTIEFQTSYQPPPSIVNSGGFNMRAFLLSEGCIANLKIYDWRQSGELRGKVVGMSPGDGGFMMRWALAAKRSFLETYRSVIPAPERDLISGATLGTRYALRGQRYRGALIEDFFRHSGVGHVLAVSGLHISVVSLLLYSLFKMSRVPPKYFAPILILLLFSFTLLTGARPSSLRATIMNAVIILTFVYGGSGFKRATYAGLAISAILILFRRPMVLYSAGFLLSFGAVLSLILISPPVERILKQLRGALFISAVAWYAGVVIFACRYWSIFLRWEIIVLLLLLLWGMLLLSAVINRNFPSLLKFRFDRIPPLIRVFLAAQLAIQIGMMIPMSAFFFGNFPIAGMFVNLIAIPLVGVVVQIGILIGLAGLVPFLGWLAVLFGAANWLFAYIFIFTAWAGSVIFPYPPVPKPSVMWMVCYYLILLCLLSSQLWFKKVQTLFYKMNSSEMKKRYLNLIMSSAFLCIGGTAMYRCVIPSKSEELNIDILSGTSTPVVVITGDRDDSVVINSGSGFFAKRALKNLLLSRSAITIKSAFATGRAPSDGAEGFAILAEQIPVDTVFYPAFLNDCNVMLRCESDENSYNQYVKAIGAGSTGKMSSGKRRWLKKCWRGYCELRRKLPDQMQFYKAPGKFQLSKNVAVNVLSPFDESYPAPAMLEIGQKRLLVFGDLSGRSLFTIPKEKLQCDSLVIPIPMLSRVKYYKKGLRYILAQIKPEKIIICINEERASESRSKIVDEIVALCSEFEVLRTDREKILLKVKNKRRSDLLK